MLNREILEKAIPIVQRLAKVGLDESTSTDQGMAKWFFAWSGEVAGELGEVWSLLRERDLSRWVGDPVCIPGVEADEILIEVGDVLWSITALALLCDLDLDVNWDAPILTGGIEDALLCALRLLEMGKKTFRDGIDLRPISKEQVKAHLVDILTFLNQEFNLERSLDLVDQKLRKRYPEGYSPEASVQRVEKCGKTQAY